MFTDDSLWARKWCNIQIVIYIVFTKLQDLVAIILPI